MKPRLTIFAIGIVIVLSFLFVPVGESKYFGRDVGSPSCGDERSCHGPEKEDFDVVVSGPSHVEVNEVASYMVTILDGPGMVYGFYVVVQTHDGKSQDISGEPLVTLISEQENNLTHDRPLKTNHIEFTMRSPRYAGEFTLIIVVNSGDGDGGANRLNDTVVDVDTISEDGLNWTKGDQTGPTDGQTLQFSDEWAVYEKKIKVHYPEKEFDPMILNFGCGVVIFILLTMGVFIVMSRRG